MKKKTTKITELVISEENEELAIDAISLVTSPAIEVDFVYFNNSKNNLTFAKVDEEKRELISPALIPNKQIYRYDANTDSDYYVYFSKDTVKKAAYSYLKHNNHHKATYQHEQRVSGVLTVESWIKEGEQDKSNLYGYDLSVGTWFVKMKIENEDLWQRIKAGEIKGLSIEGYFIDKLEQMGKQFTDEEIRTAYKELQAEGKIKVELNKVEDTIKAAAKIGGKILSKQADILSDANDIVKLANGYDEYIRQLKAYEKSAKELGIDKVAKDAAEAIKHYNNKIKQADKMLSAVKSAIKR
mgnify:CR=1 FL=1|tara:strand:- start:1734 stop:2627 length:894 start_codon:yes stop_codon:yes gene_type:complete